MKYHMKFFLTLNFTFALSSLNNIIFLIWFLRTSKLGMLTFKTNIVNVHRNSKILEVRLEGASYIF